MGRANSLTPSGWDPAGYFPAGAFNGDSSEPRRGGERPGGRSLSLLPRLPRQVPCGARLRFSLSSRERGAQLGGVRLARPRTIRHPAEATKAGVQDSATGRWRLPAEPGKPGAPRERALGGGKAGTPDGRDLGALTVPQPEPERPDLLPYSGLSTGGGLHQVGTGRRCRGDAPSPRPEGL